MRKNKGPKLASTAATAARTKSVQTGILGYLERSFELSLGDMRKIIRDFQAEMESGLSGKRSSLKMLPAYVDKPTGEEKGRYLALDLGGTNFRVLLVELKGAGRVHASKVDKFVLTKRCLTGNGEELFNFLAVCIKSFLSRHQIQTHEGLNLGFTFSFPMAQSSVASGKLLVWTKGFNAKGVVGKDVVRLLSDALVRNDAGTIRVAALANDTVGTLVWRAYSDPDCDIGVIVGTGTNACYVEDVSNIKRLNKPSAPGRRMIVNIEWGNFNKLRRTVYDKELDVITDNKGEQILEKMVSGLYLGELSRLILRDLVRRNILFKGLYPSAFDKAGGFRAEYMTMIEEDASRNLSVIRALFKTLGLRKSTLDDRRITKKICGLVSRRAARISASGIAAIVRKRDPELSRGHTVAIDGAVYEKHRSFSRNMKSALKEILKDKAPRVKIALAKDGSGKGAAIIAAVAASAEQGTPL